MSCQFSDVLRAWFDRRDTEEWVFGVVYKTEGPCYRKPGAIMFFNGTGERFGLLSGGCLEADIQQHARRVMQSGEVTALRYDGSDEDDTSFQLGIGCGGCVYIALYPVTQANNYLHLDVVYDTLRRA